MNKLEIVNKVNTLAGTQGSVDNVSSTSGYQTTLVAMVDLAYLSIQTHREDWKFLYEEVVPLVEVPADPVNDLPSYSNIDISETYRILYEKEPLREYSYDKWLTMDQPAANEPSQYTKHPDGTIIFNPFDTNYYVTLQYFKVPDTIVTNSDIPVLPTKYHMLIVYKALIHLGEYLFNQSLINANTTLYSIELGRMMRSQVGNRGKIKTGAFV
jgi:hypothetical protein